jgi:ankyrin repeat protein
VIFMPIQVLPPDEAAKRAREKVAEWKRQKEIETAKARIEATSSRIDPVKDMVGTRKAGAPARKAKPKKSKVTNITSNNPKDLDSQLLKAVMFGKLKEAKQLIDKGADVNARDSFGQTALIWASGGQTEIAKILAEKGADVNARDNEGTTVLMKAAGRGSIEIAIMLIDRGADVNASSNDGLTALIMAVDHYEITKMLIEKGAEVNARTKSGVTALWHATHATTNGQTQTANLLRKYGATE